MLEVNWVNRFAKRYPKLLGNDIVDRIDKERQWSVSKEIIERRFALVSLINLLNRF